MNYRHTPIAESAPGEVVWAAVRNPLQNAQSQGKPRPVVLVRRDGCRWHVMGLTTLDRYASGEPRTPVPDPLAVGLRRPGYLWGERLTAIDVLDVGDHIGWVDSSLAAAMIVLANLDAEDARAIIEAVRRHGRAA